MSQSDFIMRKKTLAKLAGISKTPINRGDFPQVFSSQEYTDFSQYQLTNTIVNTKTTPNELVAPNHQIIFNMEVLSANNCPSFAVCRNTNARQNRSLNSGFIMANGLPLITPVPRYVKNRDCSNNQCNHIKLVRHIKLLTTV
jgi:hypothetical protein